MYLTRILPALLALCLLPFAFHAKAESLEDAEVESFIDSLGDLRALSTKHDDLEVWGGSGAPGSRRSPGAEVNWMSDWVDEIEGHPGYSEFEDTVEEHGFTGPEHWGQVGDRVLTAYFAATMDQQAPAMQAQIEERMHELENDPNMTAEEKQIMKETLNSSMAQVGAGSNLPSADIEAVRPYMDDLQRALARSP